MEKYLYGIEKPGRYLGNEINACHKDFDAARVRFALLFPDVYEVGLSHLGLRLLYYALNRMERVVADRVYAPWFDFEQRLRAVGDPLRGLESERPLKEFDFLGFSLQYELSYTNILTMLDLGGIPLRAEDRGASDPWVIAGGPCAFNPEPLADFFDFILLGEAEEVLAEVIKVFERWKDSGGTRREFLEELRKVDGVYIPSFFHVRYADNGRIVEVEPRFHDYTNVRKRLVMDLDGISPIPETPLVPLLDIVHNRLDLEIARGCTRGCRFCQAGFIYRPVRERNPGVILEKARASLANSGFEDISLLSLSTGDYCRIHAVLSNLMESFAQERVAVSFPSMRVGTLTPELMELVKKVRKTGFTLAPEAGSERLRRVINKPILDEDLLSAAGNAFKIGWRVLKLYFMMGLPTERREDLDALVELSHEVWKLAKPTKSSVNVSVSTFVPKPLTPFQWSSQLAQVDIEERLDYLRERLKRPGMRFKWNTPAQSILEAVFARGDRRLGAVLHRAWHLGARFDGWTELFREDIWREAFLDTALNPSFYAHRERPRDEIFPWDHLSAGVEKEFLWEEYERALTEDLTPDCRWDRCSKCGVCDHRIVKPHVHRGEAPVPNGVEEDVPGRMPGDDGEPEAAGEDRAPSGASSVPHRQKMQSRFLYRLCYGKYGKMRFLGQLEIAQVFSRAVRRARLPAAFSEGFHPHVKLSFVGALPLGFESLAEEAYLTLSEQVSPEEIRLKLNRCLPEGLRIGHVASVVKRAARSGGTRVTYRVSGLSTGLLEDIMENWRRRLDEPLIKKTKRGETRVRLGEVLADIRKIDGSSLEMDIFEGPQGCFRPTGVMGQLLQEPLEALAECRICKVCESPAEVRVVGG